MDAARFLIIRNSACDQWLIYEQYRLAYTAAYESNRRSATRLSWGTIVLGALTTAAAAIPEVLPPVTIVFGVLTTIAAGLQQAFKWEEKALGFWQARAQMEKTRMDIKQYISGVAYSRGASYDALFETRLTRPTLEVSGLEPLVEQARRNLAMDSISTMELAAAVAEIGDEEEVAVEGAEGIEPVQRVGHA